MTSSLAYWLRAAHWPQITPKRLLRLIRAFPSITDFMQAGADAWRQAGATEKDVRLFQTEDSERIQACLRWAEADGHHLLCVDDPRYPPLLKEIADPPLLLYVQGDVAVLSLPQVALVGSRSGSVYGLDNAFEFAQALAKHGYGVTSGLARGIDAAAHQGALKGKGVTIAVMGSGMLQLYPKNHAALASAIVEGGGALVTEFSVNAPPLPDHFPRRNRIIAGLSVGVLVIEAAPRSGSLITARLAVEAGREVFAIPGPIHHPQARGCHSLIKQGATLVETADDILIHLGALTEAARLALPCSTPAVPVPVQYRSVFDHIDYITTAIDVIILRSGLTASEVSSILLSLTLLGHIQSVVGGYVRVATNH